MTRSEHQLSNSAFARQQRLKFSRDFKNWREKKDLTLDEVAAMIRVSKSQVYAIESGRSSPSFSVCCVLCREMGTQVPEMFK